MHIWLVVATLGLGAFAKTNVTGVCSNAALEQCLTAKGVPFKVPCDSDWGAYNRTHNIRLPVTPAAIVLPQNTGHISTAVVCAGKSGVKVQAKSGGRKLPVRPCTRVSRSDMKHGCRLVWVVRIRGHRRPSLDRSPQLQQDGRGLGREQHRRGGRWRTSGTHGQRRLCPSQEGHFSRRMPLGRRRRARHARWLGLQLAGLGTRARPHCWAAGRASKRHRGPRKCRHESRPLLGEWR